MSGLLEQIIALGTNDGQMRKVRPNQITCADGLRLSVIAGAGTYCTPRPDWPGGVAADYPGPYRAVEVGFPSVRPEPWDFWQEYAEESDEPTATVYAYVPIELVRALIQAHGGEAS